MAVGAYFSDAKTIHIKKLVQKIQEKIKLLESGKWEYTDIGIKEGSRMQFYAEAFAAGKICDLKETLEILTKEEE